VFLIFVFVSFCFCFVFQQHLFVLLAACSLRSRRRWVVSGTPIQNRLEDLYSLLKFLKLEPWSNFSFWKTHIEDPFEKKDDRAANTLRSILSQGMLRRTKESKGKTVQ
jgi:DNA repair protein RAD5